MNIDVCLKDCEQSIDKAYQNMHNKVEEIISTMLEFEKNNEIQNKDFCSIIPKRYCILKNKEDKISSMTLFGRIIDINMSNTVPRYDLYLFKGDHVIVSIFCKFTINKIIKKLLKTNSESKNEIIMIPAENNFFYKCDKNIDEDNNLSLNRRLVIIPTAIKLYIAYFNKFKSQKEIIYSLVSNDPVEIFVCKEILNYCGFIDSSNSSSSINISSNHNDLLIVLSNEFTNTTKKELFSTLDSNSIICLAYNSINFKNNNKLQLDPPDIQYLSKMNITLNFFEIESFLNNMINLGSCVNFLDDLLSKISISNLNLNSIEIEVNNLLLKLQEIGNGGNLKQIKGESSSEETILISFMNIINNHQNISIENNILILY